MTKKLTRDNKLPNGNNLPAGAFAIVGDWNDTSTWKLPHHSGRALSQWLKGRIKHYGQTVDWDLMPAAVAALSPGGFRGQRVQAGPEDILAAAQHLAVHYRAAGRPLPDALAVLV